MARIQREASGVIYRGSAPRPKPLDRFRMFFHAGKTVRLVRATLGDDRVPVLRKALFLWALAVLALLLLIPDAGTALLSVLVPIVGPALDLPTDAVFDWSVAIALSPWLLRLLPADIVAEHQETIFGGR